MTNKTTEALKLAEEALQRSKRNHYYCEDTWYSCPKAEDGCANDAEGDDCNCGADVLNAENDKALAAIREALAEQEKQEPVAYIRKDQLQRAMKYPCLCEISPEPRSDRVEIYAAPVSAEAAVLAEREACAKVCEEEAKAYQIQGMLVADECAAAIRARGEK